jgi:hypothetical protein
VKVRLITLSKFKTSRDHGKATTTDFNCSIKVVNPQEHSEMSHTYLSHMPKSIYLKIAATWKIIVHSSHQLFNLKFVPVIIKNSCNLLSMEFGKLVHTLQIVYSLHYKEGLER